MSASADVSAGPETAGRSALVPRLQMRWMDWTALALALAAPGAERTVFGRLYDSSSALMGQFDGLPGRGDKPTSWWQEGWQIRDVYDLTLASTARTGPGRIDLLVYNTHSGENLSWEGDTTQLYVGDLNVVRP